VKQVTIKEVSNGYLVEIDTKQYVYSYLDIFKMLEFIGKQIVGKPVKVEEK